MNSPPTLAIADKVCVADGKVGGISHDKSRIDKVDENFVCERDNDPNKSIPTNRVRKVFLYEGYGFNNPRDRLRYDPLLAKFFTSSGGEFGVNDNHPFHENNIENDNTTDIQVFYTASTKTNLYILMEIMRITILMFLLIQKISKER